MRELKEFGKDVLIALPIGLVMVIIMWVWLSVITADLSREINAEHNYTPVTIKKPADSPYVGQNDTRTVLGDEIQGVVEDSTYWQYAPNEVQ